MASAPSYAEYVVLRERRLGFVRYLGTVDVTQILRLASALWGDSGWQAEFDLLVDMAQARVEMSADARGRLKAFFESYPLASRGRLVHVTGPESLQYSRLSESSLPHAPRAFARVSTIPEALAFLYGTDAAAAAHEISLAEPRPVDLC